MLALWFASAAGLCAQWASLTHRQYVELPLSLLERYQRFFGDVDAQTSVAPILLLDAIWLTVPRPTGENRRDRRGCLRAVKRKAKVALLVALGVWPSG